MENTFERIVQIIPATGWYAKYTHGNCAFNVSPIICFALVEWIHKGRLCQEVRAIDPENGLGYYDFAQAAPNFAGYSYSTESD